MGSTFVISGLRSKRARLAGEIKAAERALAKLRRDLATLDATINLFEPATNPELIPPVRPYTRGLFFAYGEVSRLCYRGLRERSVPVTTRWLTDYVLAAKGLEVDWRIRGKVKKNVRDTLARLERRACVRCVMREPEGWWELVGR